MRNATFWILCGCVVMLLASQANAGVQSTLKQGQVNELEDEDYELVALDVLGDGKVNDGDLLLAILEVTKTNIFSTKFDTISNGIPIKLAPPQAEYSVSTNTFTGITLIKADGDPVISGGGMIANYTFMPPTAAEWLAATGLVVSGDNVMAIAYDDPVTPGPGPHIDANDPGGVGGPGVGSIGTTVNGLRLWEFGFVGDPGEFWVAQALDTLALDGIDPTDITQITGLDFLANLNVVARNAGLPLAKHNALGDPDMLGPLSALFGAPGHFQLQGNLQPGGSTNFDIRTDTNMYILPVPEPASLLTWAGLLGLALFTGRRRRRA